jgi:hypothetical protein
VTTGDQEAGGGAGAGDTGVDNPDLDQPGVDDGFEPAFVEDVPSRPAPILSGDWTTYGLGQGSSQNRDANRPSAGRREPRDDSFLDYRRENTPRPRRAPSGRSSRFTANVISAGIVGLIVVAVVVAGAITSAPAPTPSPKPTIALATPTASPTPTAVVASRSGQIHALIDLPVSVYVPDRAQAPDDGTIMYLAGGTGGIAVDPQTGAAGTVFGGEAFKQGVRRSIVATGSLWVSWWPATYATCGPACWAEATTYRLNVGTGKIQKTYPKTYIVGLASDGLWLASGNKLDRLDLTTAAVAGTTPWPGTDEPRVGCDDLWAINVPKASATSTSPPVLGFVDVVTGQVLKTVELPIGETYGPVSVASRCWMMNGLDGISVDKATLVQIGGDGSITDTKTTESTLIVLDGEFWTYATGGVIRRLEPSTVTPYGASYKLAVAPTQDDASRLFASLGSLWMLDGQRLVGFDVLLGIENSAGG